jgi:hypothetical protein
LTREGAVVTEELVARRYPDFVMVEGNAAQAAIRAAAREVDVAGVPVDDLASLLPVEIDDVDAAVAFTLLAAADDGRGDQLGLSMAHAWRPARGGCSRDNTSGRS